MALFLFAVSLLIGRPQPPAAGPALESVLRVSMPTADVAVMLDASLSMRNHHYGEVRQAVMDFVPILGGKEMLHLRVFGDVAGAPLEGPADSLSGNVADQLPAGPIFQNTDLGMAIGKGLEFFERAGASELQVLFLLTDGLHQPPAGSPYSRDFANDPDWQALRDRARALCERRQVFVYGFGLGGETDVSLLLRIFPAANIEVATGSAAQVAATLRRMRARLHQAQLRRAAEAELRAGHIELRYRQDGTPRGANNSVREITLRNTYARLPVVMEGAGLSYEASSRGIGCEWITAPSAITLAPGQQWQGRIQIRQSGGNRPFHLGRVERRAFVDVRITPIVRFPHEAELAELLGEQTTPRIDAPPLHVELRTRSGLPYWLVVLSVLAVSAIVWVTRRRRKLIATRRGAIEERQAERTRLAGAVKLWPARAIEPNEDGTDLSVHNAQRIALVITADGRVEPAPPDAQATSAIAHLSAHLVGATPGKAESGKVEFRLEAARGHRLAFEAQGEWREASRVTLCDRELIEIDGRWRARYANHRLRTRDEVESARKE